MSQTSHNADRVGANVDTGNVHTVGKTLEQQVSLDGIEYELPDVISLVSASMHTRGCGPHTTVVNWGCHGTA